MAAWSEDMIKNWSDAQQRYWNAWSDLSTMGKVTGAQPSFSTPAWTQGLEQWWKAVSPHTSQGSATDAFQRMVEMGKVYMNLAENAYNVQQSGKSGEEAMNAWMDAMENGFRQCCTQLDMSKFGAHGFGVGQAAMDSWQRVLSSMGMQAFQSVGAGGFHMPTSENWSEQFSKVLATPAVGYNRESQERLQALTQLGANYQEAMDEYLKAFAKQGIESVQALRERVALLRAEGKRIESLRELYDLWVDVNEEVYAKFAMTDEYQVVYGDLVNALMELKQGINGQLDSLYVSANLPTRAEMNVAFQKQQEVRRENRALRKQLQELSRKVEALAAAQASAPAVAPVAESVAVSAVETATVFEPAAKPKAKAKTPRASSKKA
ncbi:class III poly(R)-hydroxyalkanoic acid synthase subunit PhaE [Candidatus Thiothrix anitrata]|uniref:Poly(3-hydroxyalkanoate) polymerase subunit PhaE n=1 Tax=Candidatus Thiothrix anitrata TaxID=2823902 RepID=A0ABX7X0C1_9GAMM|nr:class III poly(R)-hydroxyalkanoic acid synthase subunit PhaE [Candidatus Thiothrix anitrata]QTR49404.1 class III poly(R)-hydroxyalkanoic acid synthase subunit PhaE [Candidatus Thiothrix anitrata]